MLYSVSIHVNQINIECESNIDYELYLLKPTSIDINLPISNSNISKSRWDIFCMKLHFDITHKTLTVLAGWVIWWDFWDVRAWPITRISKNRISKARLIVRQENKWEVTVYGCQGRIYRRGGGWNLWKPSALSEESYYIDCDCAPLCASAERITHTTTQPGGKQNIIPVNLLNNDSRNNSAACIHDYVNVIRELSILGVCVDNWIGLYSELKCHTMLIARI